MLTEIQLENYRGFENHTVPLRNTTIVVGKNNAGKSTIVESLRLVSLVAKRLATLSFSSPPEWLDLPKVTRGVSPSLRNMEINLKTITNRYGEPPAMVKAKFISGEKIEIYLNSESIYAIVRDASGKMLTTKGTAAKTNFPEVEILPQVAPLVREEKILSPDYVRNAMSSVLASLHFRNQLHYNYELFEEFCQAVKETWSGLRVLSLDNRANWPSDNILSLLIQDGGFPAEASWMGHGLQMWLQTMWFLVRAQAARSIILDEPDVYMHADLQRKLIRYLRGRFSQVIIATHSTEIISEVEPEQILIVDKRKSLSAFADSLPAVQRILEGVGSVHNLQLTRLWNSRRFLMIEGEDIAFLKRFQDILFPESNVPFDTIPAMEINGWGGWNYAVGTSMFLENAGGEGITPYCILDRDYHTKEDVEKRYKVAKERGVQLHIWKRKEIENYLLVPSAIQRVIVSVIQNKKKVPSRQDIDNQLEIITNALRDDVLDNMASELKKNNKNIDAGTANKQARAEINAVWENKEGRISLISGKAALSMLTQWSKETFGVSFSPVRIASEMRKEEISQEVVKVIAAIENGCSF